MHHGHVSHAMTQHRQTRLSRVPGCSPSQPSLALVSPHQLAAGDLPACPSRLSRLISCLPSAPRLHAATAPGDGAERRGAGRTGQPSPCCPSSPPSRPCHSTGKGQGGDRTSALRGQDRRGTEIGQSTRLHAGYKLEAQKGRAGRCS